MTAAALTEREVVQRLRAAGCVFAEDEARLIMGAGASHADVARLVEQRAEGTPLEYLLGAVSFAGLRIALDAGVFVPRRRTQLLAREAARLAAPGAVLVELCCGAGAVAAAVRAAVPGVELHAADLDPIAVRCARRNVSGSVYQGDLYEPLPARLLGRVAVLVANAPYVPTRQLDTMPIEARRYEPPLALDGGSDGLDVLRRVIVEAPRWLSGSGRLLVETSSDQAAEVAAQMAGVKLHGLVVRDESLDATVVIGSARTP
jgi:release factor glutamine methyltransferase